MGKSITNPIGAVTNMATGGLAGYDPSKGLTWGVTGGLANKASGGSLSKIGEDLKDIALGSKTPGTPDEVIDLADPTGRAFQGQAIGKFGDFMNQDTNQLAANQTANLENQARAGANDQEIRAKQMVAQRGLGGTSLGLNAILNQKAGLGDQIGAIRANQPMLQNQMSKDNLQFASGGINQILNEQGQSKIFKQGQQAQGRGGGLLGMAMPIAGQVLGGMAGSGAFNGLMGGGGSTAAGYSAATTPFVGGGMGRNPYA